MFLTLHGSLRRRLLRISSCAVVLLGLSVPVWAQAGAFNNFIGITLIDIPAGSFQMGSCKVTADIHKENKKRAFLGQPLLAATCPESNVKVNDNETPQHTVSIPAFQMGKTLITLGQYKRYATASGATHGSSGWNLINDDFRKYNAFGDDAPVVQVSWQEAKEFVEWLNKNKPANDRGSYRLPTEAEWEYACRAGGNHTYCGSNNPDAVAWYDGNNNGHQQPVGLKAPNAWGLYGMSGNVWQWVEDAYHDSYRGAPVDGSAWMDGSIQTLSGEPESSHDKQQRPGAAHVMRVNMVSKPKQEQSTGEAKRGLQEQQEYDAATRALSGFSWRRDTTTARVLRGGSWKFTSEFARATARLGASPGNWYYGNGFRIVRVSPR